VGKGRGAATVRSRPDMGCRSCGRSCTRPRPVDATGIGIEWPRSPALPTAVRRQDTPGQLPRPRFRALLGALSALQLHFGISISAIGAEKLLSRMPGQHILFDNETKIKRSSRGCFRRSSARLICRSAQGQAQASRYYNKIIDNKKKKKKKKRGRVGACASTGQGRNFLRRAILSLYGT